MSIFRALSLCLILLAAYGCTGRSQRPEAADALHTRVMSFWDGVQTSGMADDSLEQRLIDYLYLVGNLDSAKRDSAWLNFCRNIDEQPNRIAVDYLGEPGSPLYSPLLLEEYLSSIQKHSTDETDAMRAEFLLENIRKNQPGMKIADLDVIAHGKTTSLYRLIEEADADCLIVFYDPDCDSCAATFEQLRQSNHQGLKIITVSVTDRAKSGDSAWTSCIAADMNDVDNKFYFSSLPRIFLVSDKGIIRLIQ